MLLKSNDMLKKHAFIATGSIVTVQREIDEHWTYSTITDMVTMSLMASPTKHA